MPFDSLFGIFAGRGGIFSLYLFREVRYTIFRATNSRDTPIRFWPFGARATPGYRMRKSSRRMHNSRLRGGNAHLLARRQGLARGVELVGETQSARVARIGMNVKAQVNTGNWKRARCSHQRFDVTGGRIRCCDSKHRETLTPFSAHLVGRQPD